tara:strand:+ start:1773 stop:2282 length:510 start_codon:yes stop_codon:yes gene_type:complete
MSKCVSPVNMCEICCEEFIWNNNENKFKCWSSQPHLICKDCCKKESERRQEKGFNNPNECILCKPFQEKVEYYTVNINQPVTIEIRDTRDDNKSATIYSICSLILIILIGTIFWNISVAVWNISHGQNFENQTIIVPNPIEILGGCVIFVVSAMISSPILICCYECKKN